MGAIAGVFHPATPKPVDPARVRAMADVMAHRGPDGAGVWTALGVGFAHRRLATVGGIGAAQPVATADLRYALMLDGTILNHRELREELRASGRTFRGEGDAEVALEGFALWGPSLLDRMEGAFAVAVHDAATQTLFLARDRLGAKPLHYVTLSDGALAFASELKGLLAHPLLRRAPDVRAVADYLAIGHVPDDTCVIAGVSKLPAGHFLLVERGRASRPPRRWWARDGVETAGELLPVLREAVRAAMTADTPPGALLSGGSDDAAVVALMAEASAQAVRTATVAIEPPMRAAAVAQRFATAHRERLMTANELPGAIPAVVAAFDEPFGDPAALLALHAAAFARETGAVALSGGGVELLLGGAPRASGLRERLLGMLRGPARSGDVMPSDAHAALFSAGGRQALDGHRVATATVPADLMLADRAGMAAGLEWRLPLLDHHVVRCVAALPSPSRIGGDGPRSLIYRTMRDYLPEPGAASPSRWPVADWLRGPLAAEVAGLAGSRVLADTGWFDRDRIAQLADAHRRGEGDHAVALWRLLMLERSLMWLLDRTISA